MKKKILILAFIFWGLSCFVGGYLVKAKYTESKLDSVYFQDKKIVAI